MRSFNIPGLPMPLTWNSELLSKLERKDYRHAYMAEGVKTWLARQVRLLREKKNWSQEDLGHACRKPQSAISRIEDPDYGRLNLQTLFELAAAFDVALLVQFVDWDDWLGRMDDVSANAMQKESFAEGLPRDQLTTFGVAGHFPSIRPGAYDYDYIQRDSIRPSFVGHKIYSASFPPEPPTIASDINDGLMFANSGEVGHG